MPRFRITTWPGSPLPLLPFSLPADDPVDGAPAEYEIRNRALVISGENARSAQPAGETYLRLGEVDLDDPLSILSFANNCGILGARFRRNPLTSDVSAGGLDFLLPGPDAAFSARLRRERQRAEREQELTFDVRETLLEFRVIAELLRDLGRAWQVVSGQVDSVVWESDLHSWLATTVDPRGALIPREPDEHAAVLLATYLHVFLGPFGPRVLPTRGQQRYGVPVQGISLAALCALELYNHIAEKAEYKLCENAACGRLYVRHSGRAKHAQHRKASTKYCSAACARAVMMRRYRARKRTENR